jgi:hypothetical protein
MANAEEKKNSPFDSFLIDDPTPNNNNRITITNEESPTICISCQQDLRLCSSKILSCLHSICISCLEKLKDPSGRKYSFEFSFIYIQFYLQGRSILVRHVIIKVEVIQFVRIYSLQKMPKQMDCLHIVVIVKKEILLIGM